VSPLSRRVWSRCSQSSRWRRGRDGAAGGSISGPSAGFYDFAFTFVLVVGGVIALLVLVSTVQVHAFRPRQVGPWHIVRSILPILLVAGIAALVVRLHIGHSLHIPGAQNQTGPKRTSPAIPPIGGKSHTVGLRWEVAAILGGLLILGGAYAARRRRPEPTRPTVVSLPEELSAAFDESLEDLRAERDPRRAVIAAYARAERILATHGAGRRPSDTPTEYLASVLRSLRVRPDAVLELTTLFQRAKFSRHAVHDAMKEDAISALAAVRDELRETA
jgi:hypothetical protein